MTYKFCDVTAFVRNWLYRNTLGNPALTYGARLRVGQDPVSWTFGFSSAVIG